MSEADRNDRGDESAAIHLMPRCPACGRPENLVWVHGHGQCAHSGTNVMPCCDGAVCEDGGAGPNG